MSARSLDFPRGFGRFEANFACIILSLALTIFIFLRVCAFARYRRMKLANAPSVIIARWPLIVDMPRVALIPPGLSCYLAWHSDHLTLPVTFTLHVNHRAGTDGVAVVVATWNVIPGNRIPCSRALLDEFRKNSSSYADVCQVSAKNSIGTNERRSPFLRHLPHPRQILFSGCKLAGKQT